MTPLYLCTFVVFAAVVVYFRRRRTVFTGATGYRNVLDFATRDDYKAQRQHKGG